jgi:hypothetical protein
MAHGGGHGGGESSGYRLTINLAKLHRAFTHKRTRVEQAILTQGRHKYHGKTRRMWRK